MLGEDKPRAPVTATNVQPPTRSHTFVYLRMIIEDVSPETGLSSEQRLHLLEWATALTALPCGGLKEPILLRLDADADDNDLPNVHTCTHEVHLPAYSSREQLRQKLLKAVEHRHDGFQIA